MLMKYPSNVEPMSSSYSGTVLTMWRGKTSQNQNYVRIKFVCLFTVTLPVGERERQFLWTVIELIVTLLVSLIFNDEFSWILEFEGAALSVLLDGFQVVCEQAQSRCWPSRSIPPFKFYVGLFLLFAILICFHSYDTALCGSILVSVAVQWRYSESQMTFCFSVQ